MNVPLLSILSLFHFAVTSGQALDSGQLSPSHNLEPNNVNFGKDVCAKHATLVSESMSHPLRRNFTCSSYSPLVKRNSEEGVLISRYLKLGKTGWLLKQAGTPETKYFQDKIFKALRKWHRRSMVKVRPPLERIFKKGGRRKASWEVKGQ